MHYFLVVSFTAIFVLILLRTELSSGNYVAGRCPKQGSVEDYYDMLEEIGSGGYGVVYKCREKKTGIIYAAKIIHKEEEKLRKEVDIMNQICHPYLLKLHDAYQTKNRTVLIVEHLSGRPLDERIGNRPTETQAVNFMKQICEGVQYLHNRNIFHMNISPGNILCHTQTCDKIKLIDFGVSVQFDEEDSSSTQITEARAKDLRDIGEVAYFLLTGKYLLKVSPMPDGESGTWFDLNFNKDSLRNVSNECSDFIERIINENDCCRNPITTIEEALNHPWLIGRGISHFCEELS